MPQTGDPALGKPRFPTCRGFPNSVKSDAWYLRQRSAPGRTLPLDFSPANGRESVLPADRSTSREGLDFDESTAVVESPGGIAPPGAPRTVHDPLESHGSRCSAVA